MSAMWKQRPDVIEADGQRLGDIYIEEGEHAMNSDDRTMTEQERKEIIADCKAALETLPTWALTLIASMLKGGAREALAIEAEKKQATPGLTQD